MYSKFAVRMSSGSKGVALAAWGAMLFSLQVWQAYGQTPTCANPGSGSKPTLAFMMNKDAYLSKLQAISTSTDGTPSHSGTDLVSHFFNNSASILFTNNLNEDPIPSGWNTRGGFKDDSYANMTANEATIGATSGISVIIYDNEEWSGGNPNATPPTGTPSTEQTAPASTTSSFVGWAHNHFTTRYTAMSTPARDLTTLQTDFIKADGDDDYYLNVQPPYSGTSANRPFPTWGADADIFEIQSQAHTTDGTYISFTTSAASEARSSRGSIQLMAGVSTAYGTDSQMCDAVLGTYEISGMIGYWLNFSSPATNTDYQQAVNFLNLLFNDGF